MTTFQTLILVSSLTSLIVSIFTAYRTFLRRFDARLFIKPRVILTRLSRTPSIVAGFEIANGSSSSGSIDDIILIMRLRREDTKTINDLSFIPTVLKEDFSDFEDYSASSLDLFQSISLTGNTRLTRYVLFNAGANTFVPSPGEAELKVFFRVDSSDKWREADRRVTLSIGAEIARQWADPEGDSIMLEMTEIAEYRAKLMKNQFR